MVGLWLFWKEEPIWLANALVVGRDRTERVHRKSRIWGLSLPLTEMSKTEKWTGL